MTSANANALLRTFASGILIGALVLRLEKEYSNYLSTTWKTQALKRVIEAFDEKEFQLNLTALGGIEDADEAKIRNAAVVEVERRLQSTIEELHSKFLTTFLTEKIFNKLRAIDGIGNIKAVQFWELKDFLEKLRTQLLECVDAALVEYCAFWIDPIEGALTGETEVIVENESLNIIKIVTSFADKTLNFFPNAMKRRQMYTEVKKAPLFHLARYSSFVKGILANQHKIFKDAQVMISDMIHGILEEAFDRGIPYIWVLNPHGYVNKHQQFHVEAYKHTDSRSHGQPHLFTKIAEIFAIHTPTPTTIRAQHEGVAIGVVDSDVAARRRELEADLVKVRRAQDGICAAFGVTEEEIAAMRAELDRS